MATRIIQFGTLPSDILAALTASGYEVDACGTSTSKLKHALQQPDDLDAIALAENSASKAVEILPSVRSFGKIPLILFQDETKTCDPSQFDLVIPEHAPLPSLLKKVAALIDRSRAIRAETKMSREQFRATLRQSASLRAELATARVEFQKRMAKLTGSVAERVSIPCVLVVDDHARWRDTMCSVLKDCADCQLLCEAEDGIEAVQRATELQPQLILLDLELPHLNGIEAAKEITQSCPNSAILFVSMNNSAEIVSKALSTGAKGYLLKIDAGNELRPAIEAVLDDKQYLSRGLRGRYSARIH